MMLIRVEQLDEKTVKSPESVKFRYVYDLS